jgi:hypothetical protein
MEYGLGLSTGLVAGGWWLPVWEGYMNVMWYGPAPEYQTYFIEFPLVQLPHFTGAYTGPITSWRTYSKFGSTKYDINSPSPLQQQAAPYQKP